MESISKGQKVLKFWLFLVSISLAVSLPAHDWIQSSNCTGMQVAVAIIPMRKNSREVYRGNMKTWQRVKGYLMPKYTRSEPANVFYRNKKYNRNFIVAHSEQELKAAVESGVIPETMPLYTIGSWKAGAYVGVNGANGLAIFSSYDQARATSHKKKEDEKGEFDVPLVRQEFNLAPVDPGWYRDKESDDKKELQRK